MLYGGHDPGLCCRGIAALTLWMLGYADQALDRSQAALALAQELGQPAHLAFTLNWAAAVHHHRRALHNKSFLDRFIVSLML